MEILILAILLLKEIIPTVVGVDGNYSAFLTLEEAIPNYSGERLFNHSCVPDGEAHEIVRDLQLSAQEKATYLQENLCKIEARLTCDNKTRTCACMAFGGNLSVWDNTRIACYGLLGSSCKIHIKSHPGWSKRLVHKPECVPGATCANYVYDTTAVCECEDDQDSDKDGLCSVSRRFKQSNRAIINLCQAPVEFMLLIIYIISQAI